MNANKTIVIDDDMYVRHYLETRQCIYCPGHGLRHSIHARNHWLRYHFSVQAYWRCYIWLRTIAEPNGHWLFVRNYSRVSERNEWRRAMRRKGIAVKMVLTPMG